MKKNKARLGLWSTLAGGLLLVAATASGSINSPMKNAQQYDCTSTCYGYYRTCLMSGKAPAVCGSQYQTCLYNCGGGGGTTGAPAE